MDRARHELVTRVFMEVYDLSAPERNALLADRCGDDSALRAEVEALLRHNDERGDPLDEHALRAGQQFGSFADDVADPVLSQQQERFRILRKIGQGGMGAVYLAEQQHPYRRVALKMIRPGARSSSALRRFKLEVDLLGRLQHPGIAQVYEAGMLETESGHQPYFAMEFIDGLELRQYASRHQLGVRERLELVARICDAVNHAHQNGIIHRDLKPDNILVVDREPAVGRAEPTGFESLGQPKILDFGVARATDAGASRATLQTEVGQLIGTLSYMSPEQVLGDSRMLDTRSDIYALGVILYELVSGKLPFDLSRRSITQAARIIREEDPTPLGSIQSMFRGEIDAVAHQALEKEPASRYQSASELAADIRRHLNDETVLASSPSVHQRIRKVIRRNKRLFAAAMSILVLMTSGVIAFSWLYVRSERAHRETIVQRNRADAQGAALAKRLCDSSIRLADFFLQSRQIQHAHEALAECPSQCRKWEWRRLRWRASDRGGIAFPGRGKPQFTPDGRFIISLGQELNDPSIYVHDAATGALRRCFREEGAGLTAVSISADGQWVLASDAEQTLELWDVGSQSMLWSVPRAHGKTIGELAIGPRRELVATLSFDGLLRVRDASTGALVFEKRHSHKLREVAFSPDGRFVACAAYLTEESQDWSSAHVYDAASGELRHVLTVAGTTTYSLSFSPDGRRIVTGNQDGTVTYWDADSGRSVRSMRADRSSVAGVAFSPDGRLLATACRERCVHLWSDKGGSSILSMLGHTDRVYTVAFSPDGRRLATQGLDGIRVWDVRSPYDDLTIDAHSGPARSVAFSPDGTRILTGGDDGKVRIFDTETGAVFLSMEGRRGRGVDYSADGKCILVGGGSTITAWDAMTGEVRADFVADKEGLYSVAFSPDGTRFASSGRDNVVRIWDLERSEPRSLLKGHSASWGTYDVTFSPDGDKLASAGGVRVMVWDAHSGKVLLQLTPVRGEMTSVAFSPDGMTIATAGVDRTIYVWNSETGEILKTMHDDGHANTIWCVAFSADGSRLVSCDEDGTVVLWNAETGSMLYAIARRAMPCWSVAISPDGQSIAGAFHDGTVTVWRAPG